MARIRTINLKDARLENAVYYDSSTEYTDYTSFTIRIKANDGYKLGSQGDAKIFITNTNTGDVLVPNTTDMNLTEYNGTPVYEYVSDDSFHYTLNVYAIYSAIKDEQHTYTYTLKDSELTGFTYSTKPTELHSTNNQFVLSVLDDYTVNTIPHILVQGDTDTIIDADFTLSENVYQSPVFDITKDYTNITVTITGNASIEPLSYTLTNNLQNISVTEIPEKLEINQVNTITLKVNTGYEIKTTPHIIITTGGAGVVRLDSDFSLTNDEYVVTFTPTIAWNNVVIKLTGDATLIPVEPIEYTLTNNLQNISITEIPEKLVINQINTIKLEVNYGYEIQTIPHIVINSDTTNETVVDSDFSLTSGEYIVTFTPSNSWNNVIITLTGDATLIQTETLSYTLDNDLQNISITEIPEKLVINQINTITLKINSGYEIQNTPHIVINSDATGITVFDRDFDLINDEYVVTFTPDNSWGNLVIYLTGSATLITEISKIYPYINVYLVDSTVINELVKKRFFKLTESGTEDVDLSKFIIAMYAIFPTYQTGAYPSVGEPENIHLGYYDTGIKATPVKQEWFTYKVRGNSIQILEKFNSSLDYEETDISAYLPFIGEHTLDTKKVMNTPISLQYRLHIPTGDGYCTITPYNSDDKFIDAIKCTPTIKIPYIQGTTYVNDITNTISDDIGYFSSNYLYFNIYRPIMASGNNVPDIGDVDITDTVQRMYQSFNKNYIEGDIYNLTLDENFATYEEKEEIINLFKTGVVIA